MRSTNHDSGQCAGGGRGAGVHTRRRWRRPLTQAPMLVLDDASIATLAAEREPGFGTWRGWPIIFNQMVLQDYAVLPPGRSLSQINPNGTLVMAATGFNGDTNAWLAEQAALTNASAAFVSQELQTIAVAGAGAASFSLLLLTGKIALLLLKQCAGCGRQLCRRHRADAEVGCADGTTACGQQPV